MTRLSSISSYAVLLCSDVLLPDVAYSSAYRSGLSCSYAEYPLEELENPSTDLNAVLLASVHVST